MCFALLIFMFCYVIQDLFFESLDAFFEEGGEAGNVFVVAEWT